MQPKVIESISNFMLELHDDDDDDVTSICCMWCTNDSSIWPIHTAGSDEFKYFTLKIWLFTCNTCNTKIWVAIFSASTAEWTSAKFVILFRHISFSQYYQNWYLVLSDVLKIFIILFTLDATIPGKRYFDGIN